MQDCLEYNIFSLLSGIAFAILIEAYFWFLLGCRNDSDNHHHCRHLQQQQRRQQQRERRRLSGKHSYEGGILFCFNQQVSESEWATMFGCIKQKFHLIHNADLFPFSPTSSHFLHW